MVCFQSKCRTHCNFFLITSFLFLFIFIYYYYYYVQINHGRQLSINSSVELNPQNSDPQRETPLTRHHCKAKQRKENGD